MGVFSVIQRAWGRHNARLTRRELNDEAIGGGLQEHRDQEWESAAAGRLLPRDLGPRTGGAALATEEARKRDAEIEDAHPPGEPK